MPVLQRIGAKRTAADLDNTAAACLAVIVAAPGIIPERIAAKLELASRDITLPLARLRERGSVTTTGGKRFTHYTAAASPAPAPALSQETEVAAPP